MGGVITTTATGHAAAPPDTAVVDLAVQTRAETAADALAANSAAATRLIDALKASGVADLDVATSGLSLWPVHNQQGDQVVGYQVGNNVTARCRDTARAGALIDAAVDAAGDAIRVESLRFALAEDTAARAQARAAAVRQALAQARELAQAAGVGLGRLLTLTEGTEAAPLPKARGFERAAMAMATPVEPGTHTVAVTVVAQFAVG